MCLILTLLCLLAPWGQTAEDPLSVVQVEFTGNEQFSDEGLGRILGLGQDIPLDEVSINQGLDRILRAYREEGYIFASGSARRVERDGSVVLVVSLSEGDRYTLGEVAVEGNESIPVEAVLARLDTRPGSVFNAEVFEKDMDRVLRLFEDRGFAFVQVLPETFIYDTLLHNINLTLRIIEGRRVKFAGARFFGNKQTRPDYLARESGIRVGEPFSRSKLDNAERRLARLAFLSRVGEVRAVAAEDRDMVWAEAEVEEGRANSVYGVLGLDPGRDEGLTGLIDMNLSNLTGRGREVRARWQRTTALTSRLHLAYREPFLLSWDIALEGSFDHHIRDTSYTQTRFMLDFRTRSAGLLGLSWGFSIEQVLPGSYPVPRSRSAGLTAGLSLDTRRSPHLDEYGIFYETRSEYALRTNRSTGLVADPEPTANTGKLLFDLKHYIPSGFGKVLYAGVHGREAYTSEEEVPVYDYFFLGGAASVRGYREEQFSGYRTAWANLEQRFELARGSYVYPFLDVGYYQGETEDSMVGFGFGLYLGTKLGMLGLDYGLGEGDGPLDGKIHIKLKGEF